jgi:hypothetical protein
VPIRPEQSEMSVYSAKWAIVEGAKGYSTNAQSGGVVEILLSRISRPQTISITFVMDLNCTSH